MKFSIKDFFSIWDQIRSLLRIWSHLLKKSLIENFIFCVVHIQYIIVPYDWGDPAPWFVFGPRKTLNDCSIEQKQWVRLWEWRQLSQNYSSSFAEKKWMTQYYFGIHLYWNITGNFFSHILSSFQRLLKTIREFWKYFGRILFTNTGKQSFSFKFTLIKWLNDDSIGKVIFSHGASNCHLIQFNCDLWK